MAAARYARALFDVSVKDRDLRQVEARLVQFADLIEGHDTLNRVLLNPAIPASRKRAIVEALLGHLGAVTPPVAKLLTLLAERDRLVLLPEVVRSYRVRLLDHLGVVEAHVTTAQPLTADRIISIEHSLTQASGREVTMTTTVDPEILGGLIARLGTTVYDGSIARHLERMRETLLAR
ncbi:MAG: ATP synthase F1 subunit delta [Acidobacteriota bacterium]|nr:ATP synthase F1 subunit delta [Acidobacteriota bacterium]